jgi:hypothetical protein
MNTHFRSLSNVGSMKDRRSCCNEYLVIENNADNMRILGQSGNDRLSCKDGDCCRVQLRFP